MNHALSMTLDNLEVQLKKMDEVQFQLLIVI